MAKEFDPAGWVWWQRAMKAVEDGNAPEMIGSDDLPIFANKPMTGFYRMETHPGGPKIPVAYWYDEDGLKCMINGKLVADEAAARGRWMHAARSPIEHKVYEAFIDQQAKFREDPQSEQEPTWPDEVRATVNGRTSSTHVKERAEAAPEADQPKRVGRPRKKKAEEVEAKPAPEDLDLDDEIPDDEDQQKIPDQEASPALVEPALDAKAIAAEVRARKTKPAADVQQEGDQAEVASASGEIGHNSDGAFTEAKDEIEEWKRQVSKLVAAGEPKSKAEADKLADAQTKLKELIKAANDSRLGETKPLRDQVDSINKAWNDVIDPAKIVVQSADRPLMAFAKKVADEVRRRRQQEAAEAAAAEAARVAALQDSDEIPDDDTPPPPARPAPAAQEDIKVRIGTRRTTTSFKQKVAVIDDAAKVADYFCAQQAVHPDLLQVLRKLAKKALDANIDVPGARLDEVEGRR